MYNFSIIIPHKNLLDLLIRCLESIPKRNDIQVIVVDDNSVNQTAIQNEISKIEDIKIDFVACSKSKGAGGARNVGLQMALGSYLLFADADDMFGENIFKVFDYCIDKNPDLLVFDSYSVFSDSLKPTVKRDTIVELYKKKNDINLLKYKLHTVWGKVIKRSLVQKHTIMFDEVPASNDVMFSGMVGFYAKNIYFLDIEAYCCTTRKGSICTKLNKENLNARISVASRYNTFLYSNGISLKYGENLLGFTIKKCLLNKAKSLKYICNYITDNYFYRIFLDIIDSTKNFVCIMLRINKDKDMQKLKKIE